MFATMVAASLAAFSSAVAAYPFSDFAFEREVVKSAECAIADCGLLMLGEPHGVHETPSVLYSLAVAFGTRAVAFEWSHEEMDEPVRAFLRDGAFDFEELWALSGSAEFFCGDGRITAGHFALRERLYREGRLDQVIVFDRLDPESALNDKPQVEVREREMADRLLAQWDRRLPLLALTGGFHAQLEAPEREPMARIWRAS